MKNATDNYIKYSQPNVILNIILAVLSYSANIFLLICATKASTWYFALIYAILFSFTNNTVFGLLHESVHRSFSKNKIINDSFGRISAAFFPTGFHLQRGFHLGHHRRNRTDAEMFDLYYEHDNMILKNFQWYSTLTGLYWLSVPLAALLYLFFPGFFKLSIFNRNNKFGYQSGSEEMFSSIEKEKSPIVARAECLFSFAFQIGLFYIFDLSWDRWLLCYFLFGLNWGALQYADHAWSKRDIIYGAWNLKIPTLIRWIFLNYHLHLAHHVNPSIPWIHLPKYMNKNDPSPNFFTIYFKMWLGPRPATEPNPKPLDKVFVEKLES